MRGLILNLFYHLKQKQFIELLLNQVVSQNLDNVIQDIIGHKIEKKNKVLDLSEVAVSPKNDT